MSIHSTIDTGTGIRKTVIDGDLTTQELLSHHPVPGCPTCPPPALSLVDLRRVDHFGVPVKEWRRLMLRRTEAPPPEKRIAFVTASTVCFGMARMFQIWSEGTGTCVKIFDEPRGAEAWLLQALPTVSSSQEAP